MNETDIMSGTTDEFDAVLRAVAGLRTWPKPIPAHLEQGASDEDLLLLLSGRVHGKQADEMKNRVLSCPHCRDMYEILTEALAEEQGAADEREAASEPGERLKAAFVWTKKSIRFISGTFTPVPLGLSLKPTRGSAGALEEARGAGDYEGDYEEIFHEFEADLGRIHLRLQVERLPSGLIDLELEFLKGVRGEFPCRATLLNRGRVADSVPITSSRVRFGSLELTDYQVQISCGRQVLATLDLVVLPDRSEDS